MKRLSLVVLLAACSTAPCPTVASPRSSPTSGEVRTLEASPRHTAPSGKTSVRLLARGQNAFVGRLEMLPGAVVPEHHDPTEEYIHVLSGHGTMTMDGVRYDIGPGTTIYMPAFAKVSYQNGDEPLVALQVFAGPSPADKYETWPVAP